MMLVQQTFYFILFYFRFMLSLWQKFHPGQYLLFKEDLKFTFNEFVQAFLQGWLKEAPLSLSMHWAPFWQECPACRTKTRPQVCIII